MRLLKISLQITLLIWFLLIHIADQGREINSSITDEFYHLTGTQCHRTSSHHSQTDGLGEHENRTSEDCN